MSDMSAPSWRDGLTHKQAEFVRAYVGEARGNATEAARIAGYASPEGSASANMGKDKIMSAIQAAAQAMHEANDALSPEEIHAFWRRVVEDHAQDMRDRLKAAQDAARAMAMFVDRKELKVDGGAQVVVYLPDNGREIEATEDS